MCGIFGFVGEVGNDRGQSENLIRLVRALFYYSESRGTHASGFSFKTNDRVVMEKAPIRGGLLAYNSKALDSLEHEKGPVSFIAHTRYGTGSNPKINTNNHPFVGGRFNMVHNGTIPSWHTFAKDNGLVLDSETDSEVILRYIEKNYADSAMSRTIESALIKIWGNMAVALIDKKEPDIWLFRNENPLLVFECPEGLFGPSKFWFFASTVNIFEDAVKYVFKRPEVFPLRPLGITHTWLDSNKAYRITTRAIDINGKPENFIAYSIYVNRPYYKQQGWTQTSSPPLPKVESFPTNKTHNSVCLKSDGRISMVMNGDDDVNLQKPEDRVDGLSRAHHTIMRNITKDILEADALLSELVRPETSPIEAEHILVEGLID
jgi:predicted glutamine amidotransferase